MALQCKSHFNRNIHVGVPVGQSRKKKVTFSRRVLAIPATFPPLTHSTGPKPSQLVPKFIKWAFESQNHLFQPNKPILNFNAASIIIIILPAPPGNLKLQNNLPTHLYFKSHCC